MDPITSQRLPVPPTNYPNLPKSQRVKRDQTAINHYKTGYVLKYPKAARFDWSNYDVHHIRPLQYGGDNSENNLFTLPRVFHQTIVNSWWRNY